MNPKYKDIGDPLTCLAEECAEVIQVIMKIKRFGPLSFHPDDPTKTDNLMRLQNEMDDLQKRWEQVQEVYADEFAS